LKTYKYLAALALLLSSAPFSIAQSASTPNRPSASGVIGTPDPDIARQIFPDVPDQSNDILIAASSDNDAVRIGVRGHESTVQVTRDGANVNGTLSINGVPITVAAKKPTGPCTEPAFILSGDGLTFCDIATHTYVTR
jgi:hypothetical protein